MHTSHQGINLHNPAFLVTAGIIEAGMRELFATTLTLIIFMNVTNADKIHQLMKTFGSHSMRKPAYLMVQALNSLPCTCPNSSGFGRQDLGGKRCPRYWTKFGKRIICTQGHYLCGFIGVSFKFTSTVVITGSKLSNIRPVGIASPDSRVTSPYITLAMKESSKDEEGYEVMVRCLEHSSNSLQ